MPHSPPPPLPPYWSLSPFLTRTLCMTLSVVPQAFEEFLRKVDDESTSERAREFAMSYCGNPDARFARVSLLRTYVADMATRAAYVSSCMYVLCAIRQMGGRSEAATSTFAEVFPTAEGVQLQPDKTKRRQ